MTQLSYCFETRDPATWQQGELDTCLALLAEGGAVDMHYATILLPRARTVALARHGAEIVGLAALKALRPSYNETVSRKSGFQLPADSLEMGYVVVSEQHRGRELASTLVSRLIPISRGRLFATTYAPAMIHILSAQGFEVFGKAWKSRNGKCVSLLVHSPKVQNQ